MILTVGNQNKNVAKSLQAKTWVIMKLTIALLLFFTFQVSAKTDAQKITIVKSNVYLSEVFKEIEHQTGYLFFYDKTLIKNTNPIDISVRNVSLSDALSACLKDQQLTYSIVRNTIVIQELRITKTPEISQLADVPPPVEIRGRVTDENGNPLSGASITIKGTLKGVSTDTNGNFVIEVPNTSAVLVVSFTGYVNQEVPTGNRSRIDVKLVRVDNSLNEVVVTALGVKKLKRGLVYAASEVKGSEFTEARENNVASALTGKIAGVDATQIASGPGGSSRIIIRGVGAINPNANNQPLYVVNGSPIYNGNGGASASSTGFNYDVGDGISSINPDDIESITVLKSGAAAALYGSQAANGVILITTKSGRTQKGIGVDYNSIE